MSNIYIKQNGAYNLVSDVYVKQNGAYNLVSDVYAKQNNSYNLAHSSDNDDPNYQTALDSIDIENDVVSTATLYCETTSDIWGEGINRDVDNTKITQDYGGFHTFTSLHSYVCKMPKFTPILNVSSTWLLSNGITISGSTASISNKKVVERNNDNDNFYNLTSNNVLSYLDLTLLNNSVILSSKEKNLAAFYSVCPLEEITQSDIDNGYFLNREKSSYGGLCLGYSNSVSSFRWRIEVDVTYNIILYHAASGTSRTLTKTIKFRTYNS